MKISIKGDLNGKTTTYVLCDGVEVNPNQLNIAENRDVQVAKGLRWKQAKPFDRKNKTTTISFSVTLEHTDLGVAETFMLQHGKNVPNHGTVTLVAWDNTSSILDNAQLTTLSAQQIGRTTTHTYAITGGEMR